MSAEQTPILPHLASEFLLWLWHSSTQGRVNVTVEDRIGMRLPGEIKVTTLFLSEDAAVGMPARVAVLNGAVLNDMKVRITVDDHEYVCTLSGPELLVRAAKLPRSEAGNLTELVYDRGYFLEALRDAVGELFSEFANARTGPGWPKYVEEVTEWLRNG
jgi:hypothetical protein